MPFYRYRGANADGRIVKGQIEALNESDLEAQIARLGFALVRAELVAKRHGRVKRMPTREIINFLFQLEMMIRAGVPIRSALADMRDDAEMLEGHNIAGELFEKIEAGATLAESIAAYPGVFSDVVINLIRTGEVSGQLPEVLDGIVTSLKWQDEMASQTKRLLMYPSFVFTVISGVFFFLMTYVVPQLLGFLTSMGETVPPQTIALIWVSNLFVNYWWAILFLPPVIIAGLIALSRMNPNVRFRLHQMQLKIPYIGVVLKKLMMARFADSFALMYRSGIPLLEGLYYCQASVGNMVIERAIERVRGSISNGNSISASFASEKLFPALVIRMLRVGETTGGIDSALGNISYFYTRDISESVGRLQALIEPAMTVFMGLVMGWIMLAVLSPIYDTISKLQL